MNSRDLRFAMKIPVLLISAFKKNFPLLER